jgi:hypothetical protein
MDHPAEESILDGFGRKETPAGSAERHRESSVLTQVYERCREAFMVAEAAFAQLEQAVSKGRFDGPELEEFLAGIGNHRQWADLALWMADAEVEQFAQERAAPVPKPSLDPI